jgi:hypothetical protein
MLNVLNHIRRETRHGTKCSEIMRATEDAVMGHFPCDDCSTVLAEFRCEFVPLADTVYPGDADDCYKRIARRHGIKPTGSL